MEMNVCTPTADVSDQVLQGYLARKKPHPPRTLLQDPTVGLCVGPYGGPRGGGGSYERGTPVAPFQSIWSHRFSAPWCFSAPQFGGFLSCQLENSQPTLTRYQRFGPLRREKEGIQG